MAGLDVSTELPSHLILEHIGQYGGRKKDLRRSVVVILNSRSLGRFGRELSKSN